jgi:general secretion pathway protein G
MKNPRTLAHRGFTLIEILIVMTIIIILAAMVMGGFGFVKTKQKNHQAEIQIKLLENAIQEYHSDNGDYPGDENAGGSDGIDQSNMLFQALYWDTDDDGNGMSPSSPDEDQTIYLDELDPDNDSQKWVDGTGATATITDPWGEEYRYRRGSGASNPDFDLWSTGPDGPDGAAGNDKDDIKNF